MKNWYSNYNLKKFHTFKVETKADILFVPNTQIQASRVLKNAYEMSVPVFMLGSGTNLLIRDGGLRGLVIYQGPRWLKEKPKLRNKTEHFQEIEFSSRTAKADALTFAYRNNLRGLEFSAGIPGTLGGAVWMNAGTKWGSYKDVIVSVKIYHPQRGMREYSVEELGLNYRTHDSKLFDSWTLIVSVTLRLKKNLTASERAESLTKINEILLYRGQRQPLELPNCGSVFKNPLNSEKGAGRLIEATRLKGHKIGGAFISLEHANFFHNSGSAKASDIESLIQYAQNAVKDQQGVAIDPEVIRVGDF